MDSNKIEKLYENEIDNILDEIEENEEKWEKKRKIDNDVNWTEIVDKLRIRDMNFIKNLVTSFSININVQNPLDGKTLLIYAVIIGELDLVKTVCNFGADVNITDNDGFNALYYALKYGRYKITELVYYRQISGAFGNDLKNISKDIHKKNKECELILNFKDGSLSDNIIQFIQSSIEERAAFDHTLLYYAWYFVVKKGGNPFDSSLWRTMMEVYSKILSKTNDKAGWKWLKQQFITSLIWYLPHPINNNNEEKEEEKEKDVDDDGDMENVLKCSLFYELLTRVRKESKIQSDWLLAKKIKKIKTSSPNEWNELISYNINNTKYALKARQDLCECIIPRYSASDLSEDIYPPSTHFNAKKHYDTNIYLNELIFRGNILNPLFQSDMNLLTKEICLETNDVVDYRAGPVKTLIRSQTKVENDYINEEYPTSAKILDINRCALQFKSIPDMMKYIKIFTNKIKNGNARSIHDIIRCKNGWTLYNTQYPQYTDIKLNVLVKSKIDGMIICEIQFLLDLMSAFKKKSHKLYAIERKFEMVYNYSTAAREISKFKDYKNKQNVFMQLAINNDVKYFKLFLDLFDDKKLRDLILFKPPFNGSSVFSIICKNANVSNIEMLKYLLFTKRINDNDKCWELVNNRSLGLSSGFLMALETLKKDENNGGIVRKFTMILNLFNLDESEFVVDNKNYYTLKTPPIAHESDTDFKFVPDWGSLYSFGLGRDGQSGLGHYNKNNGTPTICNIFSNNNLIQIAAFYSHCLGIDIKANVYSWGNPQFGRLGLGEDLKKKNIPTLIGSLSKYKAVAVAVGYNHSLVLTDDGNVWSFGRGNCGQLGLGDEKSRSSPQLIETFKGNNNCIVHISCGRDHNCAISRNNTLFTWGLANSGQCGLGESKKFVMIPTAVDLNINGDSHTLVPVYTDCGNCHTLLLTMNGTVLSFGYVVGGRLGHGNNRIDIMNNRIHERTPKVIDKLTRLRVTDISAGDSHSLCVTEDGELYTWGKGDDGQLGHADDCNDTYYPKKVDFFNDRHIVQCEGGYIHSAVITSKGELFMFGGGQHGALGQGEDGNEDKLIPTKCAHFKEKSIMRASLGNDHTAVIVREKEDDSKSDNNDIDNDDIIYLKNKQEKVINGGNLGIKSYKIYIKNKNVFGRNEWILK